MDAGRRTGALGFGATVPAPLTGCVALGRCAGTAYEEEMFTANSLAVIQQAILMCAAEVLFRVLTILISVPKVLLSVPEVLFSAVIILLSFAEIQRTTAPSGAHVRNAYAHRVHAACNVQRATCTWSVQRATYNVYLQLATCNVHAQRTTCSTATCDVRRATCNVQRVRAP